MARFETSTNERPTLLHSCKSCPKRWNGTRTSHCSTCHATFSGVSLFDQHRQGGHCVSPQSLGLVLNSARPYECWGTGEPGE